jgi:hypothetical protein
VCTYSERVRKLQASIEKSVLRNSTSEVGRMPMDLTATLLEINSLVLLSFIYGFIPSLQEVVAFVNPPSFDEAMTLAQRKKESLRNMAPLQGA